jgi:hypothetical protein
VRFFTPRPPGFTHRARLEGCIPVWLRLEEPDGCELVGTNVVADWAAIHLAPVLYWTRTFVAGLLGVETPDEWMFEITDAYAD